MWGYHLTVDCAGCNGAIRDEAAIRAFAADMVSALGMVAFGAPMTVRFGVDPKVAGFTLVQLIESSNITGHFCEQSGEAYIDIFSCKTFAIADAIAVIEAHFAPQGLSHAYRERQAPAMARPRAANG